MNRVSLPRAVVFDLDGTLVDSLSFVLSALTFAVEPFGGRPTMEVFGRLGGPPNQFMSSLLPRSEDVPAAIQRFKEYHQDNAHRILFYDGVGSMIEQLRSRGIQVAIWTGRDRISTEWLLRQHRFDGAFSAVVCGDDLATHKPDPEGLREIMRRLELKPDETLFVGDADVDVLGGSACGVATVLIRHARNIEPQVAAQSWRVVASPFEAYKLVLGWIEPAA